MRPFMTEEEAKTKWCPMVRDFDETGTSSNCCWSEANPDGRNPIYSRCIGSNCMWWGWFPGDAPEIGRTTKGRCAAPGGTA